ncbi:MAG TPA: GDSL-type esterase/lipase family protein, partial [Candidatus Brocadiia bacterium]|nr:GDSL-type esterase/lipase family protein [Candidatus Brocadiia bacterium]
MKIVTFGDSTTAPRGKLKTYSDCLREDLSAKGVAVEVVNAGIGGNTTRMALARFQTDVLDRKPDLVVIQFGINDSCVDVWRKPPATGPRVPRDEYVKNLEKMAATLQERGCRVILMTPNLLRWTPRLKTLYGQPPYDP